MDVLLMLATAALSMVLIGSMAVAAQRVPVRITADRRRRRRR